MEVEEIKNAIAECLIWYKTETQDLDNAVDEIIFIQSQSKEIESLKKENQKLNIENLSLRERKDNSVITDNTQVNINLLRENEEQANHIQQLEMRLEEMHQAYADSTLKVTNLESQLEKAEEKIEVLQEFVREYTDFINENDLIDVISMWRLTTKT